MQMNEFPMNEFHIIRSLDELISSKKQELLELEGDEAHIHLQNEVSRLTSECLRLAQVAQDLEADIAKLDVKYWQAKTNLKGSKELEGWLDQFIQQAKYLVMITENTANDKRQLITDIWGSAIAIREQIDKVKDFKLKEE